VAHYAFLDNNNMVTEVIVGIDENQLIEGLNPETWYGNFRGQKCVRTSYNGSFRKNYAGVGMIYKEDIDAFITPKPFESWILDEESGNWNAPIEKPIDDENYVWNETLDNWERYN
jgi:hypothetical protein